MILYFSCDDCKTMIPSSAQPKIVYEYYANRLYLNITNRCTNACTFCAVRRNRGFLGDLNLNLAGLKRVPLLVNPKAPKIEIRKGASSADMETLLNKEPCWEVIISHLESHKGPINEVVFCGAGEPLLRFPTVLKIARYLKKKEIPVRINTNGHGELIHGKEIIDQLKDCVDRISISLNGQDKAAYMILCQPSAGKIAYDSMLEFCEKSVKAFRSVTFSAVDDGSFVDPEACRVLAEKMGAHFRLR